MITEERIYGEVEQVVLRDGGMEAYVAPDKGARIVQIKTGEVEVLHRIYPSYQEFGEYLEYGGIEYLLGSAPGSVYDRSFEYRITEDMARFWCFSRDIVFEKTLRMERPFLRATYSFANLGERFLRFTFSIHPEVRMGNHRRCEFAATTTAGRERQRYPGPGQKRFYMLTEPVVAVENPEIGQTFLFAFPGGVVDRVELYHPQVDTHLCPQIMLDSVGLAPRTKARYQALYGVMKTEKVEENLSSLEVETPTYAQV